jgi:hypothetical protein
MKLNRALVETSLAIRRAVGFLLRKLARFRPRNRARRRRTQPSRPRNEEAGSPQRGAMQPRIRELKREIRKREVTAGASLEELKHT